ncbi:dipeptide ABC transporter ATP-binding protein [Devosia sp. BK]|uniref:ABC transporter ATP-binding protein n=1 Tax=Devosia sp. BK TaxID=2871706 RepID=UPI002939C99B|nr:dipeptide ABC transporter ATP-binding protein [Devosia sp. BK]MDV3253726.1 dipeptide ABC transporter ATP-binding protein [Devosia sp. BK]
MTKPILEIRNLVKHYKVKKTSVFDRRSEKVHAVDGVSLKIEAGRTMGLVGESGCGKSTLGKLIVRLEDATAGEVLYHGENFLASSGQRLRDLRKDLQIIFQDPYASLNPRMTVQQILEEPFEIHCSMEGSERHARVRQLLDQVGLSSSQADRYPHEFSGGQRQRIGIARAIALNPKLIVCDEPVSALDVSIQSQVLNLLKRLQREMGLSYLFIAHGLAAVKHISDDVGVMYLGKLVEAAPKSRLFAAPAHPYTQALISAIPAPNPRVKKQRIVLQGDVPSPIRPPAGCRFHTRCPRAADVGEACRTIEPKSVEIAPGHNVACHLYAGTRSNV